ncbi:unnamed protein product, partial [Coregonus sp. 'balchen']
MEDGHTLYDYNVGLNDIVQLLIRSQAGDAPDNPLVLPNAPPVTPKECDAMPSSTALPPTTPNTTAGAATTPSPAKPTTVDPKPIPTLTTVNNNNNTTTTNTSTTSTKTSNTSDPNNNKAKSSSPPAPLEKLDNQPSTSTHLFLIDPGIGVFKINELVDCRDISIGAWFEACIDNVTCTPKGQNSNSKAPTVGKVGRPSKRTNGKLETEPGQGQSHPSSSTDNNNGNNYSVLNLDSGPGAGSSTSQTDSTATDQEKEDVTYHIKYDDYPENGVVAMCGGNVRPRARTLLRWDQLMVGLVVMVNYNVDMPEERGFWFDAEITVLNEISRTNKEVRIKILLGGPGDVIPDCKLLFLDEIYQIEKTGAPSLSAADGQFKLCVFVVWVCVCMGFCNVFLFACVCANRLHMYLSVGGCVCFHVSVCVCTLHTPGWIQGRAGRSVSTARRTPDSECRFCSCCVCGGKQDAHMQLLCDECNMAFHIYCLNPPLSTIPDDEDWYCPTCKNDTSEVVKAGEKLKASKKKAKMPSAHTESQRDWGKGMACVGRTKECTIVPSNHYGPVPGVPVGTTWKFRVQVSEAGVHRPHVGGIHGRSNDGSYSLVLAGGFEDEV